MCRIKEVKNLMEDYKINYWEASEIFDNEIWYDNRYVMPYCFSKFKSEVLYTYKDDNFYDLRIKVIKEILKKEELVLWKDTSIQEYKCPECGCETGHYNSSIEEFHNPKEIINTLSEYDSIDLYKNTMCDGNDYYCVSTMTDEEIVDESPCEACEEIACAFYDEQGNYKEGGVDNIFDSMIWAHGLATGFSGSCDAKEIVNRIVNLDSHSEWQICCSHKSQRVGPIGVYMKGHAQYVSNIDLFSRIDSRGYRVFDPSDWRAEEGLIFSPEEISLDSWDHSETILVNHRIVGIWVKEWALKDPSLKKLWDYLVPIAKDNGWLTHVCKARRE